MPSGILFCRRSGAGIEVEVEGEAWPETVGLLLFMFGGIGLVLTGGGRRSVRLSVLAGIAVLVGAVMMALSAQDAKAETALTSWYGPGFAGNPTASGEIYDPYGFTAAHKTLPLGTELVVNYGGRSVNVVVNDRGPYIEGRELDLSQGAAEYLGLTQAGVDYVEFYQAGSGAQTAPAEVYDPYASGEVAYGGETYETYESSYASEGASVSESYAETSVQTTETQVSDSGTSGAYQIQPGDTLSGISAALGVPVEQLAATNGVADVDFIVSGQTLYY